MNCTRRFAEVLRRLDLTAWHLLCRGALLGVNLRLDPQLQPRTLMSLMSFALLLCLLVLTSGIVSLSILFIVLSPIWLYAFSSVSDEVMENRAYLSVLGIAGLGATVAQWTPWLTLLLIAFYALRTIERNRDWSTRLAFYTRAFKEAPAKPRTNLNYAMELDRRGRTDEAIQIHARLAKSGVPYGVYSAINLSAICMRQGQTAGAADFLRSAVKHWPDNAELRINYTAALMELGDYGKALEQCDQGLELRPGQPQLLRNRAKCVVLQSAQRNEAVLYERGAR